MSRMSAGTELNILTGLGNGFDPERAKGRALLVGGGCGVAPLFMLAKKLVRLGKAVDVVLGFNTKDEIFLEKEFLDLNDLYEFGCEGFDEAYYAGEIYDKETQPDKDRLQRGKKPEVRVAVTTVDGSYGIKGFVTDAIAQMYGGEIPYYYACGPLPMLKALKKTVGNGGELSLEERMGCGFGACVGCSVKTTKGFKKVCADGPVFPAAEVLEEV
ncbi:MAG: hypothetical protein IJL07_03010 [Lachnospiraceae bacterium]|nr:hypothetical protein [Lachnospiraceae bacterium]